MSTVIEKFLYLGSIGDACTPSLLNELEITHLINLSLTRIIPDASFELLHLPLQDRLDENIDQYFLQSNQFIERCQQQTNGRCLVFCQHGRSRSVASQFLCSFASVALHGEVRVVCRSSCDGLSDRTSRSQRVVVVRLSVEDSSNDLSESELFASIECLFF